MIPLPEERVPSRVVIEAVEPEIDAGRFPVKRTAGEEVAVSADVHTDGHDMLAVVLRHRQAGGAWAEVPMAHRGNDRWEAAFPVESVGWHEYTVEGWIDWFGTLRRDLGKKADAGQEVQSELLELAELIRRTAGQADGADAGWLRGQADHLEQADAPQAERVKLARDPALMAVMTRHPDRSLGHAYERVLRVWVDREKARFSTWYEFFPRSCGDGERHGTFRDVERRLPSVAAMGFDTLYLPPIHPIGRQYRKGPNNTLTPGPTDPGSPWAIGGPEGGHKAVHPELGTLGDFDRLVKAAERHGIEIALDVAFQCSPDHPYVKEHPEWFKHRPDGTIKYAENPPKKYQDIYPLDFECSDWRALWTELLSVVLFWADRGVRVFRVDNPHTKPFRFWEWLIASVLEKHPGTVFLSEAFTRPKVMKYLAKSGFTQSYTYYTWRNTKYEITTYFTELTQTAVREYMRPNPWPNTPDILPEFLQHSGPQGFRLRLVLAATLGASYGLYGPPYEVFEATPVAPGKEEYRDSEKYQLRQWDWDSPNVFREFITLVNRVRRENPALQFDHRLRFYETDNDQLLFFGKTTPDYGNIVLVVANLDPHHVQSGTVRVPLIKFGLGPTDAYQVQDLLTGAHFLWYGERNYVSLDPHAAPVHVLRLRRKARTERDFDYFM
jgi:starch synthase (maltosyl-transferring)